MREFLARYMPPDYSAHGGLVDHLISDIHVLMLVLFLFWGGYFAYVLVRFRGGRQRDASYEGMRSQWPLYSVAVVMAIEFVHLFAFSIPAWALWAQPLPRGGNPLELRIIAEQFSWNIQYPGPDGIFGRRDVKFVSQENPLGLDPNDLAGRDDVIALNELHLEVNRPVILHITSKDVIHSFKLPVMRAEQDAIPGLDATIHFTPTRVSGDQTWDIACAQLCGLGHYRMRGQLIVEKKADLKQWLASQPPPAPAQ
jgi:cytochrome c oxidase subunit 2